MPGDGQGRCCHHQPIWSRGQRYPDSCQARGDRTVTRLAQRMSALKAQGRKSLLTFITAGDPEPGATVGAMHALVAGGTDVIELGIPFSDPEAEGPAIQASSERALAHGVTLLQVLEMVREFRLTDALTPVVLMGYLNSVLRMGEANYAAAAQEAGVDGLIMVNLPPEEAEELRNELTAHEQDLIFLVAPTSTPERSRRILAAAQGFVYYVSLKGITGAGHLDPREVRQKVGELRASTALPVVVGFGIKDGATAKAIGEVADGVVVGSALVATMGEVPPAEINARLTAQTAELRSSLDSLLADG